MFEKLIPIAAKYEDIEFRLSLPETAAERAQEKIKHGSTQLFRVGISSE